MAAATLDAPSGEDPAPSGREYPLPFMPCLTPTVDARGFMSRRYGGFSVQGFTYFFFVGPAAVFLSFYSLRLLNPNLWVAEPFIPAFSPLPDQAQHWNSSPAYFWAILVHVASGCLMMLTGLIQFIPVVRQAAIGYHRMAGYVYTLSGITAIVSLCVLFPVMGKGPKTRPNYELQGAVVGTIIFWSVTLTKALRCVWSKDIRGHNRWMTRNYATTMVIFTLRMFGVFGMFLLSAIRGRFDRESVYRASHDAFAPACWAAGVFNMVAVEWYLGHQKYPMDDSYQTVRHKELEPLHRDSEPICVLELAS